MPASTHFDPPGLSSASIAPLHLPADDTLAAWAMWYSRIGWRVLPLRDREKVPRTSHGVKDATTDLARIEEWWRRWPNANIGVACGNWLVVFDVDHRSGGAEAWDRIMAKHRMPAVPFVLTGDGLHFYLRDRSGRLRSCKLDDGVDVLSEGKYVLAPPSIHPTGRCYVWGQGRGPVETRGLPTIPNSLLGMLVPRPSTTKSTKPATRSQTAIAQERPTPYGRKALEGLLAEISTAEPGQRHDALFRAAARCGDLAIDRHIDAGAAFDTLLNAGRGAYGDDETADEIARTLADGFRRSASKPGTA